MSSAPWREVPGGAPRRHVPPEVTGTLLVLWTGTFGPFVRARALPASEPWQVAAAGALTAAALVATRRAPWPVRLAIGALAGAVLLPSQGETIAVWLAVGSLLGAWVGLGASPLPGLRAPARDAVAPVAVLAAVAAWQGSDPSATWQPFVPLALACAVPLLGEVGGGALHRGAAWLGRTAGHLVSTVVFAVLGFLAVLVPWLVQRPFRIDPLATRHGWTERDSLPVGPGRPWSEDPASHPRPFADRARGPLVVGLVVVVALGGALWQRADGGGQRDDAAAPLLVEAPGDLQTGSWYPELREDMAWVLDERVALRPFEVQRIWDVETRHVNVHDGERDTWRAPACDCERLTLWLYGGSAVFGFEQRDDQTIASHLARIAADDGLVVDVHNRGVPGQLHQRNAFRFAWDLSWDPAPDLVAFYDGADEVDSALALSAAGLGDTRAPYEAYSEELYDEIFRDSADLAPTEDVEVQGWPTASDVGNDDPGRLAVVRYERSREASRDSAADADVPIAWFWQPTRHSRGDVEPAAEAGTDAADPARAAAFARASDLISDPVVDLTDVFDATEAPVFADEAHHSELGAQVVAEAIYRALEPQLRAALASRGGS